MNEMDLYQKHMARLEKGENLSTQDKRLKAHIDRSRAKYQAAAKDLLKDLEDIGFSVTSVAALGDGGRKYADAIPILMKWLPLVKYDALRDDIVRTMSVPWGKPAADLLIREFKRASPGEGVDYRWVIGNALATIAQKRHFPELANIVRDRKNGSDRQMVFLALAKTKHPEAAPVLVAMIPHGEEIGHIFSALRRLKARVPRELVEPYLNHEFPLYRKQAKKLLALQDKLDAAES
ncbi:hypothetical protein [Acanthopleuribacter pedis]|uniref:HEAT repeat domain-containing protein n=1 Tax=Acanthopleuribacter pedis TaxID=442870 RepID=A0A8J7QPC9_9BACT|nr:hypothetical protein [Acanthopleuribacter pedis]MBO1321655.1 hypothetical protein [Acanthopleuribacter pedis]